MLTPYAHWPIRLKLLIPVVSVFTASALIWSIVFTDVTDTMEEQVLPFQAELAKTRALSYSLANEYREYFVNPDRDVLAEIDANKAAIEPALAWLVSNSGDGSHKAHRAIDVAGANSALKRIMQLGSALITLRDRIDEGLEKLENSENSLEVAVRAARTIGLEELSKPQRTIEFESLDDIYRTSLETLSETREFILTGNEETLGELLDYHRQIDRHIEAVTAMTRGGRGQLQIHTAIAGALISLKTTSSGLIQYVRQADETQEEMERAENVLETAMELLTLQVHRNLTTATDNGRKLVLGTIAVMLIATIVVVTFVSRRIALPLASLQQLTARYGAGQLDARASVNGNDEIGRLANAFNTMADDLARNMSARQEAESDLKALAIELEARVRERTRDLFDAKEDAENANNAKSDFLSAMSHELRTPMNAVLGYAQLLESDSREPLSPVQQESVAEILRSGQHMLELINGLLNLSEMESGKVALDLKDQLIGPVIGECEKMIRPLAEQRGINLDIRRPDGEVPLVRIDALRFKQSLINLLSNAIKYNCPEGDVVLECHPRENGKLRVSVSDTGTGIPDELQHLVFEPFERLGAENSVISGSGVGLTVTKQLIEGMGGGIGFKSAVGHGTTFWLDVPLA